MAVRGEEVAAAIEAHVRESIERMVGEIRSSVEDVRQLVDQQLKAALQSVQADVNSISFLPHIQKSIGELEQAITDEHPPAPPAAPSGAGVARLKRAIQGVERGKSQVDVLNALLEQCLQFSSRVALLILRGETFSGWKGVGFSASGGSDEAVKRFNAAPGLIPELDQVLRDERVVEWDGANLSTRLGVSASTRALLVPMVIKDKVAAAVFVDVAADDNGNFDRSSLELLVFATGLLIDTLAIRKKSPSPSLSDSEAEGEVTTALPAAARGPATAAQSAPAPARPQAAPAAPPAASRPAAPPAATPAPPAPEAAAQPSGDATVAINSQQIRDMMTPTPPAPAFTPPRTPTFGGTVATPAEIGESTGARAVRSATGAGHEERPSTQYVPPAGIVPRSAAAGAQPQDSKKHDEARRFARLLVSEIKLYNETKVDQGRKHRDLYERLKEDIDRSRQMYDERIGEDVRQNSNYFYDELVRILADGNADVLGL